MSGLAKRVVSTGVKRCVNGLHMGWASVGLATAVFMGMGIGAAPGQAVAQSYDWVVNANDLGSDPMVAGGYVNYNITVNNNVTQASQGAAPPTTIELSVPEDADLSEVPETSCTVGGSAAVFPVDGPATVVCDIPALAVDETFNLTAVVKSKVDGAIVLSGIVPTGDDFDPDNNDFSETTTILNGADVAIAVTGPDTALSGETVSYTYTVANAGPDTATGVVVEIPAMEGINLTNLPGYCSVSGGGFVCTLPQTISAEDSFEFSIGGQITTSGNGSSLVAAGSVSVDSPVDPLTDDNTDSQSTVLNEGSDVYLSKSNSGPGTILIDDEIVFTLSPGFTGDIPAGLQIVDVIPSTYEIGGNPGAFRRVGLRGFGADRNLYPYIRRFDEWVECGAGRHLDQCHCRVRRFRHQHGGDFFDRADGSESEQQYRLRRRACHRRGQRFFDGQQGWPVPGLGRSGAGI